MPVEPLCGAVLVITAADDVRFLPDLPLRVLHGDAGAGQREEPQVICVVTEADHLFGGQLPVFQKGFQRLFFFCQI